MTASSVSDILFKNLSLSAEKQKVISANIANINTPNYKTKELVFENELKMSQSRSDLKLATTHYNHIKIQQNISNNNQPRIREVQNLTEQNDGNNVSLDKQLSAMAKNRVQAQALSMAIKKDSKWLKEVIVSSGKN